MAFNFVKYIGLSLLREVKRQEGKVASDGSRAKSLITQGHNTSSLINPLARAIAQRVSIVRAHMVIYLA